MRRLSSANIEKSHQRNVTSMIHMSHSANIFPKRIYLNPFYPRTRSGEQTISYLFQGFRLYARIIFISRPFQLSFRFEPSTRRGKAPRIRETRCHARYLPRRAVEWKANCGGKIAPLQRRQVRCVCSISLPWVGGRCWRAESYREITAYARSRGCISIYLARVSGFNMYRASTNTSKPSSIRSSSACRLFRSLRPLSYPLLRSS